MRDPLSHFVSGFTEAMLRSNMDQIEQLHAGKPVAPCSIQSFMYFLERLVTGHVTSLTQNHGFHIYPMSELALFQPQVRLPTTCRVLLHLCARHHASRGQCTEGLDWLRLLLRLRGVAVPEFTLLGASIDAAALPVAIVTHNGRRGEGYGGGRWRWGTWRTWRSTGRPCRRGWGRSR